MKNFTQRFVVLLLSVLPFAMWSCTEDAEEITPQEMPGQALCTRAAPQTEELVYHEETKSWLRRQADPYALENFQRAYDKLSAGESVQRLTRSQQAAFAPRKLRPTHYTVKIYPKTEEEQTDLENTKDIYIAYFPFDYVQVPEEEAQAIASARSVRTFPEKGRYSVTYDDYETIDGPVEPFTVDLPVLYAVWPCDKPFPADMDYEIMYEAYLPHMLPEQARSASLDDAAMSALEREAIAQIYDTVTVPRIDLNPDFGFKQVLYYDSFLNKNVPVGTLKVRCQNGSSIRDLYTNSQTGKYKVPIDLVYPVTKTYIFQAPKWKITSETSTVPLSIRESDYEERYAKPNVHPRPLYPFFEIQCAMNYFYNGSHKISKYYYENGIRIIASTVQHEKYAGLCHTSPKQQTYITIYNHSRNATNHVMGYVFHEMGHFIHYCLRDGANNFKNWSKTWKLIREGYASFSGWHIGREYYQSLGYSITKEENDFTGSARQKWNKFSPDWYTPIFVDLNDDYNQNLSNSDCIDDRIKNVPVDIINRLAWLCMDWQDVKTVLRQYVNQYFSEEDLNRLFEHYDYWFAYTYHE